jgi:hypothetical protein
LFNSCVSSTLVFGSDGVLRDGERELGRFEPRAEDAYAAVVVGEHAYAVTRRGKTGWHFRLLESSGSNVLCELKVALLRSGGTLVGPSASMRVRSRLLKTGAWSISMQGQIGWNVTRGVGLVPLGHGEGGRTVVSPGGPPPLTLTSEDPLPRRAEIVPMLVFACWLIVQWEMMPTAAAVSGGGP